MQRLEAKRVNGHTYYYLSEWGWREGKCRRLSQQYLGKLEDFSPRLTGAGPAPTYAEVFDLGRPLALWRAAQRAELVPWPTRYALSASKDSVRASTWL